MVAPFYLGVNDTHSWLKELRFWVLLSSIVQIIPQKGLIYILGYATINNYLIYMEYGGMVCVWMTSC